MWDAIGPRLAGAGWQAIAFDLRGHGDSDGLPDTYDHWPLFVLDLARIAQQSGSRTRLVGHSLGAWYSMALAACCPGLVSRIVNIEGLGAPPEMVAEQHADLEAARFVSRLERLWRADGPVYPDRQTMAMRRKGLNPTVPEEWLSHLVRWGSRPVRGGFVWKTATNFSLGMRIPTEEAWLAQYRKVRCPVLHLTGGAADRWVHSSDDPVRQRRARSVPDLRWVVFERAGHYLHLEQPEETAHLILDFVA
jgi:pimeloyl-ACP methyl ester carboxylesterase